MQARVAEVMKIAAPKTDYVRFADGDATPADGTAGYCKGCIFVNTDEGKVYVNGGDEKACDFAALA